MGNTKEKKTIVLPAMRITEKTKRGLEKLAMSKNRTEIQVRQMILEYAIKKYDIIGYLEIGDGTDSLK